MKGVFFASLALSLFGVQAWGERWIVKNPRKNPGVNVIKQLHFDANDYFVVETPDAGSGRVASIVESLNLKTLMDAEAVAADMKIYLTGASAHRATGAWHVERLHYADIPTSIDGSGNVVALLDSGVDYQHSALKNHIWANKNEIPANQIDDDHNGYIDDVSGFDFVARSVDPMDNMGHGTHCAGIIAADQKAADNARGVAQGVKIMALKIVGSDGQGFLSNAAEAIQYAVNNGAAIMSNSWRIYQSRSDFYSAAGVALLDDAIKFAENKNVIFVASAGNESIDLGKSTDPMYPGGMTGHRNLFVVTATDENEGLARYSNYGVNNVHVAAPGSEILSTFTHERWRTMSGTSMATPLVAGVLALGLQNGYTPAQAMDKLIQTSTPQAGWDQKLISGGIIDIVRYLQ